MKWLTNKSKNYIDEFIVKLQRYHKRRIIKGKPKATETHSVMELENLGMIGLYEE